jgi:hypothetical protein
MSDDDDDGATVSLGPTGSDKEGATKSASNNDENKAELFNTQSKDDNTSANISAEGLASNSNETNSNRGASNDDDRVASEGDTSANTSVEERASNNIPNHCDHFLWPNLPRPGCPDKPMDIHCFLCLAYGLPKKTIYSCVQCRKGFHITCFAAFHHPELVEEEFRNSFDITARVAATRSRASQSKYISVNPSFTPPS